MDEEHIEFSDGTIPVVDGQDVGLGSCIGLLLKAREDLSRAEAERAQARAEYERVAYRFVPEALSRLGVDSARDAETGYSVHLVRRVYVSCPPEQQADLITWLMQIGAEGIVRAQVAVDWLSLRFLLDALTAAGIEADVAPAVPAAALSALIAQRLEAGEAVPSFLNITERTEARVRSPR